MNKTPITRKLLEFAENDTPKVRTKKLNELARQLDQRVREVENFASSAKVNISALKDVVDG